MQLRRSDPVPRLLEWLGLTLVPLGVSASHVLLQASQDDRPWYTPPLTGGPVDDEGMTARQVVFEPIRFSGEAAVGRSIMSSYESSISRREPVRAALAASGALHAPWAPLRAYLLPYDTNLPAQTVALQHAVALQDLAGAQVAAQGDSFIAHYLGRTFGVLDGLAIGSRRVIRVGAEDLHSLLISDRLVDSSRMSAVALSIRCCLDSVKDKLEQPDLIRDAVALLGLLTARSWTFDGDPALEDASHERLRKLVVEHWKGPSLKARERDKDARAQWEAATAEARRINLAIDTLVDPGLTEFERVAKIKSVIVPDVWSESTLNKLVPKRTEEKGFVFRQARKEQLLAALERRLRKLKPRLGK